MPLLVLQNSLQETLELIYFPETFRDKDKAKGEIVALRIKKKKASWCVRGASLCRRESGVDVAALEPHPCFLDSQQLCFFFFFPGWVCVCVFFFFFFLKVQIQREVGNREKRSNHGSQNHEVRPRFVRISVFFPQNGS